jgi:hypothetical protein
MSSPIDGVCLHVLIRNVQDMHMVFVTALDNTGELVMGQVTSVTLGLGGIYDLRTTGGQNIYNLRVSRIKSVEIRAYEEYPVRGIASE